MFLKYFGNHERMESRENNFQTNLSIKEKYITEVSYYVKTRQVMAEISTAFSELSLAQLLQRNTDGACKRLGSHSDSTARAKQVGSCYSNYRRA